jgi:hypothetical protein
MFSRPMLFLGVLVASVAVPYVLLDKQLGKSVRDNWNRLAKNSQRTKEEPLASALTTVPAATAPKTLAPSIEQAFRFDATPQWVSSRWPRASTVAGNPKELGMRVALVTGTQPEDVAGSLTYYFDDHHQLQRITFTGLTADPRRLLATVVTPHGLKSQPTTDAAHYIAGDGRKPTSEVTVRHLPVVGADENARVEVSVDLSRDDALTWRGKAEREPEIKLIPSSYRRW